MPKKLPQFIIEDDASNESLHITEISRLYKKVFERHIEDMNLTRSQWLTIHSLRRNIGISQAKLAELLDMEPITMAATINRLKKIGLIETRIDPTDHRANQIHPTPKLSKLFIDIRRLALQTRREAMVGISENEWEQLVPILEKLRQNLNGTLEQMKKPARVKKPHG